MPNHHICCSPGAHLRADEPDWDPLLNAVGETVARGFMWMYATALENGTVVHAYKHCETRRYLFLAADLQAFDYAACRGYSPTRLDDAIQDALCSGLLWGWFDAEDTEAIRDAVKRANEIASRQP